MNQATQKVLVDRESLSIVRCRTELKNDSGLTLFYRNGFYIVYQDENGNHHAKNNWGEWVDITEKGWLKDFVYASLV